jgi:hypothetical protein
MSASARKPYIGMQSFGYIREMKVDMTRTIEQDLEKLG